MAVSWTETKPLSALAGGYPGENRFDEPVGGLDQDGLDQDVLQHLLEVEANAQSLVDDAQAEADRRIAEMEKQNRAQYEEWYTREAAQLDGQYESELGAIKEEYNRQIDDYRLSLNDFKPNYAEFCSILDDFLGKER
jgi:vacuolar-type H+-ATPase subunit H